MRLLIGILICIWAVGAAAQGFSEPERGTQTRADLLSAIRPHIEWNLGRPIEFVVNELRRSDQIAFATLSPQRPGGGAIRLADTPMFARDEAQKEHYFDGVTIHVLYRKSGAVWVAVHWSIGSTDVWWASPDICADYRAVIPEYCF